MNTHQNVMRLALNALHSAFKNDDTWESADSELVSSAIKVINAALAEQEEFDDCEKSPTGKHSESWYGNWDCEHCGTGARPNAPLVSLDQHGKKQFVSERDEMKHQHHDLIAEWIKDTSRVVQCMAEGEWHDIEGQPDWNPMVKYRFKSDAPPDVVEYVNVYKGDFYKGVYMRCDKEQAVENSTCGVSGQLKVTFNGETGKLKSVEVV